jgi:phosphoglycolate phosphatase
MTTMTIQSVIFDLDGTLADTLDGIVASLNQVLEQFALPTHQHDAYRQFIGDGVVKLVQRALPADQQSLCDDVLEAYLPVLTLHGRELSKPYDGVDRVLDDLTRRGLPFAVLSNKPHEQTVDVVDHFFGRWSFQVVQGGQAGKPVKPDPQAALQIAEQMRVSAKACAFVGDSNVDIQTANSAGMIGVGAAYGLRGRDELIAAGADHIIETPIELIALLDA